MMVAAKKYPNFDVSFMTSGLLENNTGKWFLAAITAAVKKTPTIIDVTTATTTENFAAFGRPAPSSLETRTLHSKN